MKITPSDEIVTGYKATDKDMKCQGFQFEVGKWFIHEGEVKLCKLGFHFCPYMSGVWSYYPNDSKVWKIEAKEVHQEYEPGADLKYVCKMIRFVEEIKIGGYSNTGDRNTGYRNTGDSNTGDSNTGDRNTGYSNTGDSNTGYRNTGYSNTGDRNTGYSNTGDSNTGSRNTGDRNTGDSNTGSRNTGDSNATNRSSGLFCQVEPKVICFDKATKFTYQQFIEKYPDYINLGCELNQDMPFDYAKYSSLPNWTLKKCKSLHEKMIAARRKQLTNVTK